MSGASTVKREGGPLPLPLQPSLSGTATHGAATMDELQVSGLGHGSCRGTEPVATEPPSAQLKTGRAESLHLGLKSHQPQTAATLESGPAEVRAAPMKILIQPPRRAWPSGQPYHPGYQGHVSYSALLWAVMRHLGNY